MSEVPRDAGAKAMLKERETVLRRFLILVDSVVISLAYLFAFLLRGLIKEGDITLSRFLITLGHRDPLLVPDALR